MNIYDISKKTGVSIATVSRVINGSPNVSEKTREKVLKVMKEEAYTPNVFARGLVLQSSKVIGILCEDASDAYIANAVHYLETSLRANAYDSLLCCTGYEQAKKEEAMRLLLSKKVAAIILVGSNYVQPHDRDRQYILEAAKEVPVTIINGYLEGDNVYCSYCDDQEAIRSVVDKLLSKGREKILFIYNSMSYSGKKKLLGYQEAMRAHDKQPDTSLMVYFQSKDINMTKEYILGLVEKGLVFDSVVGVADYLAVAMLKVAKSMDKSVPEDLELIGYNNSILTQCCDPELSSIDNQGKLLCENAVYNLLKILKGERPPQNNCFPCLLVERETSCIES